MSETKPVVCTPVTMMLHENNRCKRAMTEYIDVQKAQKAMNKAYNKYERDGTFEARLAYHTAKAVYFTTNALWSYKWFGNVPQTRQYCDTAAKALAMCQKLIPGTLHELTGRMADLTIQLQNEQSDAETGMA